MIITLPEDMRERIIKRTHEWIRDCGLDVRDVESFVDRELVPLFEETDCKAREEENRLSLKRIEKMVSNRYFVTEGLAKRLKAAHRLRIYKLGNPKSPSKEGKSGETPRPL